MITMNNKEKIRMEIYKDAIVSEAKRKLSRIDFIQFQELINKINDKKFVNNNNID
jgi:hypothetical protein